MFETKIFLTLFHQKIMKRKLPRVRKFYLISYENVRKWYTIFRKLTANNFSTRYFKMIDIDKRKIFLYFLFMFSNMT